MWSYTSSSSFIRKQTSSLSSVKRLSSFKTTLSEDSRRLRQNERSRLTPSLRTLRWRTTPTPVSNNYVVICRVMQQLQLRLAVIIGDSNLTNSNHDNRVILDRVLQQYPRQHYAILTSLYRAQAPCLPSRLVEAVEGFTPQIPLTPLNLPSI